MSTLSDTSSSVNAADSDPAGSVSADITMPVADRLSDHDFLVALGLRVRQRREQAALTRKRLAVLAGVSERYLAQLELGSGNASMLLLRKLARALNCSLLELVDEAPAVRAVPGPALQDLIDKLSALGAEQLSELGQLIHERYGPGSPKRRARIALIGLRGAGKSTIGAQLAAQMEVPFIELDHEIEREMGCDLAAIFSVYGQEAYRDTEARVLRRLLASEQKFVLATGGSIVNAPAAYAQVRMQCYTVWLQAEPHDHMTRVMEQGDMRPMRGRDHAMAELQNILNDRRNLYQMADLTLNTSSRSIRECVGAIRDVVQTASQPVDA